MKKRKLIQRLNKIILLVCLIGVLTIAKEMQTRQLANTETQAHK